ncbi:hypothetical protein [Sediminibacterium sp. TEGAF015]|uniref:hypothetical protein n=1 Tax=Sediminibacterium sp. TEGAF015 TaxID=575378 RepID=UPI00220C4F94|nr:hypothetical protein [Sediminibacterium sp. TEGAF015]BDQ12124.1 hypothetical protein TEGAF0_13410 [Sediminibacterium sp. TEGAF015]
MQTESDYKTFFTHYQDTVHQLDTDIRFWKHFLAISIERYKADNPDNRWIHQSGFSIYDISSDGLKSWLHSSSKVLTIEIDDLTEQSNNFFAWVMNVSIIRIYNSLELLLLQTIQFKYFPLLESPIKGKKFANKVTSEIKNYLKAKSLNTDTVNNRHLIQFLKSNSALCKQLMEVPVNHVNWKTNWENFYELLSILRNIITHDGMIVSKNTHNTIKSIAADIFIHFFKPITGKEDLETLQVKNEEYFLHFVTLINDLAGNVLKFVAEKPDLNFIGLR